MSSGSSSDEDSIPTRPPEDLSVPDPPADTHDLLPSERGVKAEDLEDDPDYAQPPPAPVTSDMLDGTGLTVLDYPMRVFISWSGEQSQLIALALSPWLKRVLPSIDPWVSVEQIDSGARWADALAEALEETNFGIVCVTRANQAAPWPMFEAGALAKRMKTARVVPLCIDLPLRDLTGPLAAFQGRSLDEPGMRRLVHDLNESAGNKIPRNEVEINFDSSWPHLKAAIEKAKSVARTDRISSGQSSEPMRVYGRRPRPQLRKPQGPMPVKEEPEAPEESSKPED